MDRTAVKSSNIKAIGYDPAGGMVEVEFASGTLYRYANVPAETHAALMAAESIGSFFARNIRGKFESEKVEPVAAPAPAPRVRVSRAFAGICSMQVCAVADATDEEILEVCNRENPAGTERGWAHVDRGGAPCGPVACADDPARLHFLVEC